MLILDDLGALRLGDWDLEYLYFIADERWRHCRPTVIISNEGGLRAMLGDRTASRFAQDALLIEIKPGDPRDPANGDRRRG